MEWKALRRVQVLRARLATASQAIGHRRAGRALTFDEIDTAAGADMEGNQGQEYSATERR
jgi:hypothetical protein